MKILFVCDASDKWAVMEDLPNTRAFLQDLDDMWEEEVLPITVTELDIEDEALIA